MSATEFLKAGDGREALAIDARGVLEAVDRCQCREHLPQQHGGAGRRAAEAGALAVDHANAVAQRGEMLRHQRARDARAHDQYAAAPVPVERPARQVASMREPTHWLSERCYFVCALYQSRISAPVHMTTSLWPRM